MADPTLVNGQITDAVTQTNLTVTGDAPAQAIGSLYQIAAHSTGLAMQNAVASQQYMNNLTVAVVSRSVALLIGAADIEQAK